MYLNNRIHIGLHVSIYNSPKIGFKSPINLRVSH